MTTTDSELRARGYSEVDIERRHLARKIVYLLSIILLVNILHIGYNLWNNLYVSPINRGNIITKLDTILDYQASLTCLNE